MVSSRSTPRKSQRWSGSTRASAARRRSTSPGAASACMDQSPDTWQTPWSSVNDNVAAPAVLGKLGIGNRGNARIHRNSNDRNE
ncbi:Uncharacterised protein [Bordetella pertussis]|nr:Uncharacterised protein [Bordetella pertussis]CFW07624.1 Uncharacterised protein [Bordetella pertussis]